MNTKQRKKAETFLELHHSEKLLVLPNIWDVLGAKLLESEGFEAVATASASVAFSNGVDDNQEIAFSALLKLFSSICDSTNLPVTVDIERGYAQSLAELEENIKSLIGSGVVGLNIEDSNETGGELNAVEMQCEKIKLIRKVADASGVPLVINARTDVFLISNYDGNRVDETIKRGQLYKEAGADCFYPILCGNDHMDEINQKVDLPINVLAQHDSFSIEELERLKVSRLSFGPGVLKAAVMKMQEVFQVNEGANFESIIDKDSITSAEILDILKA